MCVWKRRTGLLERALGGGTTGANYSSTTNGQTHSVTTTFQCNAAFWCPTRIKIRLAHTHTRAHAHAHTRTRTHTHAHAHVCCPTHGRSGKANIVRRMPHTKTYVKSQIEISLKNTNRLLPLRLCCDAAATLLRQCRFRQLRQCTKSTTELCGQKLSETVHGLLHSRLPHSCSSCWRPLAAMRTIDGTITSRR